MPWSRSDLGEVGEGLRVSRLTPPLPLRLGSELPSLVALSRKGRGVEFET
jgi:hypothetical protein